MEAITILHKEETSLQPRRLHPAMIDEFCRFLDRSEKTTETYTKNLRSFFAWMNMNGITEPVRDDVIAYREWLLSAHYAIRLDLTKAAGWSYQTDGAGRKLRITCKPNTVALYLRSLCAFYTWLEVNLGWINIAKGIHAPKIVSDEGHSRTGMEQDEIRNLIRSIEANQGETQQEKEQRARIKAIVLLAATAGLRTIEISRATIGDLETRDGRAWLYIWGKGRTAATQRKALAQGTYDAIKEYLALRTDSKRPESPLFMATGNRSSGGAVLPTTISTWIKREMKAAGYDSTRLTAHSLRHTAAHQALQVSEKNIYITQRYMRHMNPATTEIYLREEELAEEPGIADAIFTRITG